MPRTKSLKSQLTCNKYNNPRQADSETLSASLTVLVTVAGITDDTEIPKLDFSSCQRLDWTDNKKDWQKYVNIKELQTDDIVASCPILRQTQPMRITPVEESIRYLFQSENDMQNILSTVATKEPGCAVVCRTWRFHILGGIVADELPPEHICDILTVTDTGRLTFLGGSRQSWWREFSWTDGLLDDHRSHAEVPDCSERGGWWLVKSVDRLPSTSSDLSTLHRECSQTETVWTSSDPGTSFQFVRRWSRVYVTAAAVTMLILCKESPLKRCIGEHTSITFSVEQAEVLMHKPKVNYIIGPAGSGKSYTGASLYKLYGKEKSIYICTTSEFAEYLKFNGCTGTLVLGDQDLLPHVQGTLWRNSSKSWRKAEICPYLCLLTMITNHLTETDIKLCKMHTRSYGYVHINIRVCISN